MHPLDHRARRIAFALAVTATVLAGTTEHAGAAPHRSVSRRTTAVGVTCTAPIQHPLSIQVTALDDVRRGQVVRLQLSLTAASALERGEVRLVSSGEAAVTGARRAALRAIPAGGRTQHEFAVRVPANGTRALVQFVVEAEGSRGMLRRGATYNLLPDGPAEQPRVTRTPAGESIAEVEARRLVP